MLRHFGARVETFPGGVRLSGGGELTGRDVAVPGDISSAAFFMVAALIVPDSDLTIRGVGVNPTRTGVIDILKGMGGDLELLNLREESGEPVADIRVRSSKLKALEISGELVPRAIDEFPAICVAASLAEGVTVITGASELRVKETDRIAAMAANLRLAGVQVTENPDGMEITGAKWLNAALFESFGDHRIAMSMMVAGLAATGETSVSDVDCIATSFPGFSELLAAVVLS
jgi:3-phosphoshikimate 1-carboxyvinyltransferase